MEILSATIFLYIYIYKGRPMGWWHDDIKRKKARSFLWTRTRQQHLVRYIRMYVCTSMLHRLYELPFYPMPICTPRNLRVANALRPARWSLVQPCICRDLESEDEEDLYRPELTKLRRIVGPWLLRYQHQEVDQKNWHSTNQNNRIWENKWIIEMIGYI